MTSTIPNPMERRHLLEKPMDAKQALALADAYLEEDRDVEALDFLLKAEATDRLEALAERAIEKGDGFLLKAVLEAQGADFHAPAKWDRLAKSAEDAGKTLYADLAQRMANPIQAD